MSIPELDIKALAAKAEEWVASKEGREVLVEALRRAESTSSQLSSQRIVDIQTLRTPLIL